MDNTELEAKLNAIDESADWQAAVRTLRGIIERLNAEFEEVAQVVRGD
jgi:hypothetical protein